MNTLVTGVKRGLNIPLFYTYLQESARNNVADTFILVFYLRDCRGGKGERRLGRYGLIWLFLNFPDEFTKVIPHLAEYGRWDDYFYFFPGALPLDNASQLQQNYMLLKTPDLVVLRQVQTQIMKFVAAQLRTDRLKMNLKKPCTLLAKWVPSEDSALDRKYSIFRDMCTLLRRTPKYLRKYYLSPLRKYLSVTERYMCENRWEDVPYENMPCGALHKYKMAFQRHDEYRFLLWKCTREYGHYLLPYQIVAKLRFGLGVTEDWKYMEENYGVRNWAVVFDNSSSMYFPSYTPYDMAISLALLSKYVVTFSPNPKVITEHLVGTIRERYDKLADIPWEGTVNLKKVWECLQGKGVEKILCITNKDIPTYGDIVVWNTKKGDHVYNILLQGKELSPDTLVNEILQDPRYRTIRNVF